MEINNRSPEFDKLIGALAKAQGSYKALIPNEDSPKGRFANLEAIILATRESLSSNGLALYYPREFTDSGAGMFMLYVMLAHESGQWISSSSRIVPGENERQTGNILEIHKRRLALEILGIAPSPNDPVNFDDNGEEQADFKLMENLKKPGNPEIAKLNRNETITKDQYNDLLIELNGFPEVAKDIMECYQIDTLADLPYEEYQKARMKVLKIKKTYDEYQRRQKS
jgi:hypothetical protein